MFDSAVARRHMVDGQIRTADVTNPSLVTAMLTVPRELFVPPALASQAYRDGDVPLGQGRFLLRPMVLAKLIHGADLRRGGPGPWRRWPSCRSAAAPSPTGGLGRPAP